MPGHFAFVREDGPPRATRSTRASAREPATGAIEAHGARANTFAVARKSDPASGAKADCATEINAYTACKTKNVGGGQAVY